MKPQTSDVCYILDILVHIYTCIYLSMRVFKNLFIRPALLVSESLTAESNYSYAYKRFLFSLKMLPYYMAIIHKCSILKNICYILY